MKIHTYLSLIPEALVLSHLPPDQFGKYMAIGNRRKIEGPVVFFELDPEADYATFKMEDAKSRCVPHVDGSPHRSVYVSVYDVIPRIPLDAMVKAYFTTPSGFTLGIEPAEWAADPHDQYFLYQELGPVYSRAATCLNPLEFCRHVADPESMVYLPRIAFVDLQLGAMAVDPEAAPGEVQQSYQHLEHLQDCLRSVAPGGMQKTKIVNRGLRPDLLFYQIHSGLFIGDRGGMKYFPLPHEDLLEKKHHLWWHSARSAKGY